MARRPNEKAEEARKLYKNGMKLVEIASQLNCSDATVRTWKNRYKWDSDGNETIQKKNKTKRNVSKKSVQKVNEKKELVADEVRDVMQNTELTDKQQLFCIYYIRCFNATKAYQKAYGVGYPTAAVEGSKHLKKPKIKEMIRKLKQSRLNREFLSEEDIFQKYMEIAFSDITDYAVFGTKEVKYLDKQGNEHTEEGSFVNLKDSSEIDGTIVTEISQGRDGTKIKLADRMKALQWISDHMNLATEKQRAEVALLKSKVDAGKEDKEDKLDRFFEQIEGALKDAE